MAQSAALARAVVGIADTVGLAGIAVGHSAIGTEPIYQGRLHLSRLLGEMRMAWESAAKVLDGLAGAVRATLCGLVHNRQQAWPMTQFRPGTVSASGSGSKPTVLPTEEDPARGPPR